MRGREAKTLQKLDGAESQSHSTVVVVYILLSVLSSLDIVVITVEVDKSKTWVGQVKGARDGVQTRQGREEPTGQGGSSRA